MSTSSSDVAVLETRVDGLDDEHSDFRRKFLKIDDALSDGKAFMASIRTELAVIKWIGALATTSLVAIFVKLLMEHR